MSSFSTVLENNVKQARKIRREELMQKNRLRLTSRAQDYHKSTVGQMEKLSSNETYTYVDLKYMNIIKRQQSPISSLANTQFSLAEVLNQVPILRKDQNPISQYKVIIGISNFLERRFRPLTDPQYLDIFRTGIVPHLSKLIENSDHPFLQLRAIAIINQLSHSYRSPMFINKQILSVECIKALFKSSIPQLMLQGIQILHKYIFNRGYNLGDSIDVQMVILVGRCLNLNNSQTNCTQILLAMICSHSLNFNTIPIYTINSIFEILINILRKELNDNKNCYNKLKIMNWITQSQNLKGICIILLDKEYLDQCSNFHIFFKMIYDIDIKKKHLWWFLINFMMKVGSIEPKLLYQWNFIQKLERQQETEEKLSYFYQIYIVLLKKISSQEEAHQLLKQSILKSIRKQYERQIPNKKNRSIKSIKKVLNKVVIAMFKAVPFINVAQILVEYSYLPQYFSLSRYLHKRGFLKDLVSILKKMKKNKRYFEQYQLIIEEIKKINLTDTLLFLDRFYSTAKTVKFLKEIQGEVQEEHIDLENNQENMRDLVEENVKI